MITQEVVEKITHMTESAKMQKHRILWKADIDAAKILDDLDVSLRELIDSDSIEKARICAIQYMKNYCRHASLHEDDVVRVTDCGVTIALRVLVNVPFNDIQGMQNERT